MQFWDTLASIMTTSAENTGLTPTQAVGEERLAWLALALSPGLGPKRILDAVKRAGGGEPDFFDDADGAGGVEVSGRGGAVHL